MSSPSGTNVAGSTPAEATDFLDAHPDIEAIDIVLTDANGIGRGKIIRRHELEAIYKGGRHMPISILGLDITGEDVHETGLVWDTGDGDLRAWPVPGTLVPLHGTDPARAQVLTTMYHLDGSPMMCDPRHALARQVAKLADKGLHPAGAFELEFFLLANERDADGKVQPAHAVLDLDAEGRPVASATALAEWPEPLEQVWKALVLAVRDYLSKSGFSKALLGLSGGIDSALVLALAVEALGADNVRAVMMPSRYTADISLVDARQMAEGLGVRYDEIPIGPLAQAYEQALAPQFRGLAADTTEENIQARIRGNLLMALSNKSGALVLTTGNKSELATGYCTLYGDMAGGYAVIKDVPKTLVYELARWRNRAEEVIPRRIIERPPSAELRPDQKDQDSLPPYDVLDAIIERYMEDNERMADIEKAGFAAETVAQVVRLVRISEYKRRQGAIGPKITTRAFGRDWRYPITNGFRE